jgi:hypothetical protein
MHFDVVFLCELADLADFLERHYRPGESVLEIDDADGARMNIRAYGHMFLDVFDGVVITISWNDASDDSTC